MVLWSSHWPQSVGLSLNDLWHPRISQHTALRAFGGKTEIPGKQHFIKHIASTFHVWLYHCATPAYWFKTSLILLPELVQTENRNPDGKSELLKHRMYYQKKTSDIPKHLKIYFNYFKYREEQILAPVNSKHFCAAPSRTYSTFWIQVVEKGSRNWYIDAFLVSNMVFSAI